MYDIITIGSSLIDSFIKLGDFELQNDGSNTKICLPHGTKVEIDEFLLKTGGGGGNTAVGFARMGFKTGVVTELGRDTLAHIILEDFKKEFVSTNLIINEKQEKTGGSVILIGKDGVRTVMVHRGASSMLDPDDIPVEKISRAEWVHISSIAGQIRTLDHIFSVLKKANKLFSWNPGKKELALIAEGKVSLKDIPCNLLFLNEEEWALIRDKQKDVLSCVEQIIVTNGKKGGRVYVDGSVVVEFTSGETTSVDDTGAGDAFIVGYVAAFLKGKEISECCQWGKKNAVSVIQYVGAKQGLLTIDQFQVHN